jgi:hypothetical protein
MPNTDVFTTKQVTEILQIHPQTFAGWLKKKILWPRIYEARGKGTAHLFSLHNVFEAGLVRELSRDQYPLNFIGAVLGLLEERLIIHMFLDRVSSWPEADMRVYLVWAGDYVRRPSNMDLVETGKSETNLAYYFEKSERTLVLNLSRLLNRICDELEELGVKI